MLPYLRDLRTVGAGKVVKGAGDFVSRGLGAVYFLGGCMSANSFNTSNENYKQLVSGGGTYRIPRFQRDYSWKDEHWEDLWSDILELMEDGEDASHYMGYLVLQPRSGGVLDVIDGQQRLTTLSIFVLAAMRKLLELKDAGIDADNNNLRLEEIRRTYIGQLDPVSLSVSAKLTLNRNNDRYYQDYLTTLRTMPSRGFKASEHAMRKATEWFSRRISDYIKQRNVSDPEQGPMLAALIDGVSRGLFFTKIIVDDDLNAYKVFETLNARGVKLSAPDLLKNYLFSVISRDSPTEPTDNELDAIEDRWSDILDRLQSENVSSYLRTYWGYKNSFVREADLFKVIKKSITTRSQVYDLVRGLEDGLEIFLALSNPDQSDWESEEKENAKLLKLFSVRQPFALLMAAKEKIPTGFGQILGAIVNITFRYNVISNLQAAEQERVYSRVAIGITNGSLTDSRSVISALRQIYPGDDVFRSNFAAKSLDTSSSRNKGIVRYILAKIEAQSASVTYSLPPPEITLEHILPVNPSGNWTGFNDVDISTEAFRLGNMILLESQLNHDAGNLPFEKKRISIEDQLKE